MVLVIRDRVKIFKYLEELNMERWACVIDIRHEKEVIMGSPYAPLDLILSDLEFDISRSLILKLYSS